MKRIILLIAICLPMMVMAQKKVAVYVTSDDSKVDNAQKEIIGGELVAAIVQTKQYKAVERTADFLQQISKEQGYQHSGNVDDDQISALGKQFGVDYVCVANIIPYKNTYYIQARLIDVETATVQAIARETSTLASPDDLMNTAGLVAHALINSDGSSYNVPTADKYAKTDKDKLRLAKKATAARTEKPEGQIVRNSYSERHILGMKEYSYGTTQMDKKAYADFLYKNCPNAFIKYYKGNQIATAGWVMFGLGCAMTVTGWTVFGCYRVIADRKYPEVNGKEENRYYDRSDEFGYYYHEYYDSKDKKYKKEYADVNATEIINEYKKWKKENDEYGWEVEELGLAIGGIGVGFTGISSIIILPIGYVYRYKAMKIYNEQCAYNKRTAACTFNLQSSRDGIGIALTF